MYCSEQKIDSIAKDIDGIKHILNQLQLQRLPTGSSDSPPAVVHVKASEEAKMPTEYDQQNSETNGEILWGHSTHILDFIKVVVRDRGSQDVTSEEAQTISSLRILLQTLEKPVSVYGPGLSKNVGMSREANVVLPPLQDVIFALKWAKGWAFLSLARQ